MMKFHLKYYFVLYISIFYIYIRASNVTDRFLKYCLQKENNTNVIIQVQNSLKNITEIYLNQTKFIFQYIRNDTNNVSYYFSSNNITSNNNSITIIGNLQILSDSNENINDYLNYQNNSIGNNQEICINGSKQFDMINNNSIQSSTSQSSDSNSDNGADGSNSTTKKKGKNIPILMTLSIVLSFFLLVIIVICIIKYGSCFRKNQTKDKKDKRTFHISLHHTNDHDENKATMRESSSVHNYKLSWYSVVATPDSNQTLNQNKIKNNINPVNNIEISKNVTWNSLEFIDTKLTDDPSLQNNSITQTPTPVLGPSFTKSPHIPTLH